MPPDYRTANEATCIGINTRVMKMALQSFIGGAPPVERRAFQFCNQQMNLHIKEVEFEPKANIPTPGPSYLRFIAGRLLVEVIASLVQAA